MADENLNTDEGLQVSEETARLAAIGRGEEAPPAPVVDDNKAADPAPEPKVRPDDVPEKFWNAETGEVNTEALLKSYRELEKFKGQAPKDDPKEDPKDDPKEDEGQTDEEKAAAAAVASLDPAVVSSAQAEYAETGDLSVETREKIIAGGIPAETLDTYLAGVAALSAQIASSIYEMAGGEDDYKAAVGWATETWDEKASLAYNDALENPALRDVAVEGLMSKYRSAHGGEGNLTKPGVGAETGDLYTDKDEFLTDLADAQNEADPVKSALARRKAVAKLERSQKAKTIGRVTPPTGLAAIR